MMKIKPKRRLLWLVIIIICVLFVYGCEGVLFPLPYRSLAPFEGKVIDAETKEPIKGAVVLGLYYYETYSVAGSSSHLKDGQESLTDEKGEFKLPRKRRWFALNRGYPEGTLVIFKPGYGVFPSHKRSVAVGENKSWPPPGKYIVYELPKLKTMEERKAQHIRTYSEIPYEHKKNYIRLYNEWRISLGYGPTKLIPKKGE